MPDLHLRRTHDDDSDQDEPISLPSLAGEEAVTLLSSAEICDTALVPWGSNYTFAVVLEAGDGQDHFGIYKPRDGENPLWDFAHGTLFLREHLSFTLAQRLGWDIVPPTVIREGPLGVGSLQLYIEPDSRYSEDYDFWGRHDLEIERMVLFDHLANNADRKMTHCMVDTHGKVWGIDHGLTFNAVPKLRTVLWQYAGHPISPRLLDDLWRLEAEFEGFRATYENHLHPREWQALRDRLETFLLSENYPILDPRRNVPWGWW